MPTASAIAPHRRPLLPSFTSRASRVGRGRVRGAGPRCYGQPGERNDPGTFRPSIQSVGSADRLEVMRAKPLFTIGLFADAQYADKDDHERPSEPGRVKRFRASAERLAEALADFRKRGEQMACVVNLGDLIDGYNDDDVAALVPTRTGPVPAHLADKSRADLEVMRAVIRRGVAAATPVYHCVGNHDCNLPREEVCASLGNPDCAAYFGVKLPRGWRLLVLDTTEVNPRYETPGSEAQALGEAYVRGAKSEAGGDKLRDEVKPWGGGLGPAQLAWLAKELEAATERNEKVIVASHCALSRTAARPGMSAWDADSISETLESFECVKVCLAGHDHPGGYGRTLVPDREGAYRTFGRVHYVTLEAMLEAPEGGTSYAVMEVYDHEIVVAGVGSCTSRRLRTSKRGVFTGVASFGERMGDVVDEINSDDGPGPAGGDSSGASTGGDGELIAWINRNRGKMGPDVEIV